MSAYIVISALSFCFIAIISYIIAVLCAKKLPWLAWLIYAIGTGLTLLSLIGNGREISMLDRYGFGYTSGMSVIKNQYAMCWVFFLLFAFIALALIIHRSSSGKAVQTASSSPVHILPEDIAGSGPEAETIAAQEGNIAFNKEKHTKSYVFLSADGKLRFFENLKYRIGYQDKNKAPAATGLSTDNNPAHKGKVLVSFSVNDISSVVSSENPHTPGGWRFTLANGFVLDAELSEAFFETLVKFLGV